MENEKTSGPESANTSFSSNFGELSPNGSTVIRKVAVNKTNGYTVNEVKEKLEAWKLILLPINNLLEWERKFDPFVIIFLDSLIFG